MFAIALYAHWTGETVLLVNILSEHPTALFSLYGFEENFREKVQGVISTRMEFSDRIEIAGLRIVALQSPADQQASSEGAQGGEGV